MFGDDEFQFLCCHKCAEGKSLNGIPLSITRMILCTTCGNKRCPHASDHRLVCTNSNEPGQPGSIFTPVLVTPNPPSPEPAQLAPCVIPRHLTGLTDAAFNIADAGGDPDDVLKMIEHGLSRHIASTD